MADVLHGGRLHAEARALGRPLDALLDFSANVNPLGPPPGVLELLRRVRPEDVMAYPDEDAPALRAKLCARHGITEDHLVLGPGGAALLHGALRALKPERVIVPIPCFQEQPRAIRAAGGALLAWPMDGLRLDLERLSVVLRPGDTVLITNPHNPTGQVIEGERLARLLWAHPEVAFVVDEAFADYAPEARVPPALLARPRTVLLQSLTKFFGMPGLRIGHAMADPITAQRMRELQPSWPIGQLELRAAEVALDDEDYVQRSLACFREDRAGFERELRGIGWNPLPSGAPFFLVPIPTSAERWAERLRHEGLLVRTCTHWEGLGDRYLRLAVRRPPERACLLRALERGLAEVEPHDPPGAQGSS